MKRLTTASLIILSLQSAAALAADQTPPGEGKLAVGIQAAPLTFGLSAKYKVTDKWAVQGVVSPSDDASLTLRALWTSRQETRWNSYIFAGIAHGDTGDYVELNGDRSTKTDTIITSGLGVEWGSRHADRPPLFFSLEFGLGYHEEDDDNDFSDTYGDGLILVLGAGLHYKF